MTVGQSLGMALQGVEGLPVTVECDLGRGLPGISIVGLGDAAVVQARDRIRAAMLNSDLAWPKSKVVMSLSPADVRKVGSGYDLAMVAAILMAQGLSEHGRFLLDESLIVGELGLDGSIRSVPGLIPIIVSARRHGISRVVIPEGNGPDAAELLNVIDGIEVIAVRDLAQFVAWLHGQFSAWVVRPAREEQSRLIVSPSSPTRVANQPDLSDVVQQPRACKALEIAAAGAHAVMLTGPPGSGKSMLAERLPGILPPMTPQEQIEAAIIHSVSATKGDVKKIWEGHRPFVTPHPSVTEAALIGGGSSTLHPGAISLAHRGVLFLDEATETKSGLLDTLRIPMESHRVEISRARRTVTFPARFQLILATNPCPCGTDNPTRCLCTSTARRRYHSKISGPIRDRIDIFARTTALKSIDTGVEYHSTAESTAVVAARVVAARSRANERWAEAGLGEAVDNAVIPGRLLRSQWSADEEGMIALQEWVRSGRLSQRGVDRALRVAWTLADLAEAPQPGIGEVLDAAEFYSDDNQFAPAKVAT